MAISYPYDPTGVEPSNLISSELHSVQPPTNIKEASFIVPRAAPFFKESLEIWTQPNKSGTKLREGRDYFFTHRFVAGSVMLGKTLYGGIAFTDATRTGNVYVSYQTLGGDFVVNDAVVAEALSRKLYADVRLVTWDQLQGVSSAFPPDAHLHKVTDIKTLADVVTSLNQIAVSIIGASSTGNVSTGSGSSVLLQQHLTQPSGAHTPAQVGLGNVNNYPIASEEDVQTLRSDRYLTPATAQYLFTRALNSAGYNNTRVIVERLESDISNIETALTNLKDIDKDTQATLTDIHANINNLKNLIDRINNELVANNTNIDSALAIATTANGFAIAANSNVDAIYRRINQLIYVGTHSYSAGEYRLIIPAKNKIFVSLVGAGGGSGAYFETVNDKLKSTALATDGEDSVVYALGFVQQPIEPYPLLVAEGGKAGLDNFINGGAVKGGTGGQLYRVAERVYCSSLVATPRDLSLISGDVGTTGISGDSGSSTDEVAGVGGYKLNDTGDVSLLTYGRGRAGTRQAGLGGSGARGTITIDNDTDKDFMISIVIGRAGKSSSREKNTEDRVYQSNGVGYTTLVD